MNKFYYICIYINILYVCVSGHGYMTFPIARQRRCSVRGGQWWPPNGDGITDTMCRAAYQNVYNKVLNQYNDPQEAATAAQYMFQQDNEYAALAGPDYTNLCNLQQNVVPNNLCAAGADDWDVVPFGDKSGMDLPGNWVPTVIPLDSNHQSSVALELEFCPTAVHDPSYYEVYITNSGFNVHTDNVVWGNLELIFNDTVPLRPKSSTSTCNANPNVYRFTVSIPVRPAQFVLYVRWQRIDPVGEGFYNCVDMAFDYAAGPSEEDVIYPDYEAPGQNAYTCHANRNKYGGNYENTIDEDKYQAQLDESIKSRYDKYSRHKGGKFGQKQCNGNKHHYNKYTKYYNQNYKNNKNY
uniref:Spindolin n=1 Tax=Heliothis armigera entomopoxvirus TaxID=10290 RepID=SPIN_HAEPV|nr:RecName: Full=Spindolin; AltName: Full=Fusolin; AltName: Full=p50; Flags: Precursor [Heliothis armigera entomopoxvirus]AAA92858.1 fusolin [Heliothis armigera entomopoxvirus]